MKNKILLITNIFAVFATFILLILHITGVVKFGTATIIKIGIVLVSYFLGVLNYLAKFRANIPKTKMYAEIYKHIIRDAFKNDKTGYRKLMQGIHLFNNN